MKPAMFPRTTLATLLALALTACGGGGSGGSSSGGGNSGGGNTDTDYTKTITSATGAAETRLACNQGAGANAACDLRMYQIMVEAFANGDDSINYNVGYGPSNHKGDLQGIIDSLDYIKSLNVNAIWLTPIFDSCKGQTGDDKLAATGYFACDYYNVDPNFGSNAKLKELVDTAHAKGLYVFLDGVFGHTSSKGVINPSPTGLLPDFLSTSSNICSVNSSQKCIDYSSANSIAFFKELASYYVTQYGIDGWRLDQAYQVPTTVWNTIRTAVEAAAKARKDAGERWGTLGYMVGEVWDNQTNIANNGYGSAATPALKSNFNFPLRYGVVQALAVEEKGTKADPTQLYASWNDGSAYPDFAMPNLMIGNHDLVRFGDLLQRGGLGNPGETNYLLRHQAAFSFLAANSGPVTIYYGDEIGDQVDGFAAKVSDTTCASQGLCDDHVARSTGKIEGVTAGFTPSTQQTTLKNYVTKLMALRETHPALAKGARTHLYSDRSVYVDLKSTSNDKVLYLLNAGTVNAKITVNSDVIGGSGDLTDLMDGNTVSLSGTTYTINVPALSGRLLSVQ